MADIKQERLFPEREADNKLELIRIVTILGNNQKIVEYRLQKMVDTPVGRSCVSSIPLTEQDYEDLKGYFSCRK